MKFLPNKHNPSARYTNSYLPLHPVPACIIACSSSRIDLDSTCQRCCSSPTLPGSPREWLSWQEEMHPQQRAGLASTPKGMCIFRTI